MKGTHESTFLFENVYVGVVVCVGLCVNGRSWGVGLWACGKVGI